mgnify:CR=1 FL=1
MQSDKPKIFFLTGRLFRQEDRLFLTGRHEDMMLGCEKNKKNVFLSSCQKNMSSCLKKHVFLSKKHVFMSDMQISYKR